MWRRAGSGFYYRPRSARWCRRQNHKRNAPEAILCAYCFSHPSLSRYLGLLVPVAPGEVLTRMGSNNSQIDEKLPVTPPSRVTFCQRKKSENGSFVATLRSHFHEFIHASMDEHRTCLRNTIQKIFGKKSDDPSENETSLPIQSTTKD